MTEEQTPEQQEANISKNLNGKDLSSLFPSHDDVLASLNHQDNADSSEEESGIEFKKFDRAKENDTTKAAEEYENDFRPKEYSDKEKEALAKGWKPKDEYKGNPEDWVPAKEFMVRGNMIDKINRLERSLSEYANSNRTLLDMVQKQSERISEKDAKELLEKKREAIVEGDVEKAEEYEVKYNELKQEVESFKDLELKQKANSELPPEVQEFVDRNRSWFNYDNPENAAMYQYAQQKDAELEKRYPQWSLDMRLGEVEKAVKSFFSDKFENPQRHRAGLVEASHKPPPKSPNDIGYNDLPPAEQKVVDQFIKQMTPFDRSKKSPMTRDSYARKLLQIGAVKHA